MAKIPYIDVDECVGCRSCEDICPEVFKYNEEEDHAEVVDPYGAPEEKIQEAIDECPAECIHWKEE